MRSKLKPAIILLLLPVFLFQFQYTAFAVETDNPLVEPYQITEYTQLSDTIINILLLGIDLGFEGYWGSGYKTEIETGHTDANMVIAINLDKKRIDLISLPRDTVTYVPGVKGIYKLNGAMNCAENLHEGLANAKHAAEWLLGNIKIDYYFAVDMKTMIALGDAIGGAEIDLEMNYGGSSGKQYKKGMQRLNGMGIMDYVRARTNATVNYTDIGRTNRQRHAMLAIFKKLRSDENMILNLLNTAATLYDGFFTDITAADLQQLKVILPTILAVEPETIGTYVFTGTYKNTLNWNFTYTDQDNRLAVLMEVYGVAAQPLPYVSSQYAKWLLDTGFSSVQYISVTQQLRDYVDGIGMNTVSEEQKEAYSAFEAAYQEAVSAFTVAAKTMSGSDTRAMEKTRRVLLEAADACALALHYSGALPWSRYRETWSDDPYINEYQFDWR